MSVFIIQLAPYHVKPHNLIPDIFRITHDRQIRAELCIKVEVFQDEMLNSLVTFQNTFPVRTSNLVTGYVMRSVHSPVTGYVMRSVHSLIAGYVMRSVHSLVTGYVMRSVHSLVTGCDEKCV